MSERAKIRDIRVGAKVTITSPHSRYKGETGNVFAIQETSQYAMVELPKGTELRLERIAANTILAGLKDSKKPKPQGDPQWFPLWWLTPTEDAASAPEERNPDAGENGAGIEFGGRISLPEKEETGT